MVTSLSWRSAIVVTLSILDAKLQAKFARASYLVSGEATWSTVRLEQRALGRYSLSSLQ